MAEKRHAEFIISNFGGVNARKVYLEFSSPVGFVLIRVTEATYHNSIEANHNSRMPTWEPRGLYGCTVFLQEPPTERTILTLYVTSDEPLQVISVDASES